VRREPHRRKWNGEVLERKVEDHDMLDLSMVPAEQLERAAVE
jgi:hypothetical protein